MAKYLVLSKFKDKYTKDIYNEGQEIEMTVKRANEAMDNLSTHNRDFIKRIDNK